jgi:hypothetical protein
LRDVNGNLMSLQQHLLDNGAELHALAAMPGRSPRAADPSGGRRGERRRLAAVGARTEATRNKLVRNYVLFRELMPSDKAACPATIAIGRPKKKTFSCN